VGEVWGRGSVRVRLTASAPGFQPRGDGCPVVPLNLHRVARSHSAPGPAMFAQCLQERAGIAINAAQHRHGLAPSPLLDGQPPAALSRRQHPPIGGIRRRVGRRLRFGSVPHLRSRRCVPGRPERTKGIVGQRSPVARAVISSLSCHSVNRFFQPTATGSPCAAEASRAARIATGSRNASGESGQAPSRSTSSAMASPSR